VSKRRLLLADDSLTIQKVVNLTFADEGIEVVAVGDGDAAMQKFVEATPDLVMADVNMPGLDGYRLCEMIKQDDETKRIPVILLVGSFEPFDAEEARRVGADDFLTKPFQSIRQLVKKVTDLLDAKTAEENFLRPVENETAPVVNFTDALKTESDDEFDLADAVIENLGDAGMDDEMIQTAQVGSLPIDETHKYESEPIDEFFAEATSPTSLKQPVNLEDLTDDLEDEDWAKTQPLSKADFEEMTNVSSGEDNAPILNFDELDLLEFPQTSKKETALENISQNDSEVYGKTPDANQNEADEFPEPPAKTFDASMQTNNFPPELIEAIANRVVEKLSNKVIKQIVSEVLAQMERKR